MAIMQPDPGPDRLLFVEEAAERLGIARTSMFHVLATREIESVRVGRMRRIPVACLEEFVGRLRRDERRLFDAVGDEATRGAAGTTMAKAVGRQGNGRSSIYEGGDGYWHGRVMLGTLIDGSPDRRHVMARTRAEVNRKVRDLEEARRSGAVVSASREMRTLEQWLMHWLDNVVATRVSRKSLAAYQTAVTKHLVPGLGKNG